MSTQPSNLSLILVRGLPGSGKTTLTSLLSEESKWPVFSIDSYFTDPITGIYQFDYKQNHLAYQACLKETEQALKANIKKVFIDNTFTLEWEMEPYFKLASTYGYAVYVVTVENRHHGKNSHQISDEQLQKMAQKYKVVLH